MSAFLLRRRRILVPLLAAAVGWATIVQPPDLYRFGQLGAALLSGRLGQVYSDSWNQAGPLQLILARLLLFGGHEGTPATALVVAVDAGLALAVMRLCREPWLELVVGASAILWFALQQPWDGHPIELLIALSWLGGVQLCRQNRWILAAALLAAGIAIAPWAVLGFPALLAVPGLARALRTVALAVGLGLAAYLPFVLTGHFRLFAHHWPVDPASVVHLVAPTLTGADWAVRLVQALVTAGGCAAIAWRYRGDPRGYYLAPFAAGALRVASDPVVFGYYWISVATVGLIAVARLRWARPSARWVAVAGLGYLPWAMAAPTVPPLVGGVVALAGLAWLLRYGNRPVPARTAPVRDDARYGVPANAG